MAPTSAVDNLQTTRQLQMGDTYLDHALLMTDINN